MRRLMVLGLLSLCGCAALGVGAAKLMPPRKIKAAYAGLQNQSVGVMVWADRGLRIDYPGMRLDVATSLQNKLDLVQKEQEKEKNKELTGTTFPVKPASIVRYQMDYPQIEAMKIAEVAPKLGVTRLIYIEIENFATRPVASVELFRGTMSGTIKVVEIAKDKSAKIAFQESDMKATFPPKAPEDGVVGSDDYRIYVGTVDAFTSEVVRRFVEHEEAP
jgi:hypothetical protein